MVLLQAGDGSPNGQKRPIPNLQSYQKTKKENKIQLSVSERFNSQIGPGQTDSLNPYLLEGKTSKLDKCFQAAFGVYRWVFS